MTQEELNEEIKNVRKAYLSGLAWQVSQDIWDPNYEI